MTVLAMVTRASSRVEGLTPTEVAAALDDDTLLVDVRESGERESEGFLLGSVSAPRGLLEFYVDPETPQYRSEFRFDRRIILYCGDGARSALAANTLQQMGYWRVAFMAGGLRAWRDEGRE
jgi:rhodanese-related sulfurtransferase